VCSTPFSTFFSLRRMGKCFLLHDVVLVSVDDAAEVVRVVTLSEAIAQLLSLLDYFYFFLGPRSILVGKFLV
jgi:hypothetical protein